MFQNYFKTTIRNLFRHKAYSTINVLGLAVGLTVSLLILLWVQDERSVDQFHNNGDRIFQLYANFEAGDGSIQTWGVVPFPTMDHLLDNYPEIEKAAAYDPTNKKNFKVDEKEFLIDGLYATSSFFDLLSFSFLEVESDYFEQPNSVLISETTAQKLFGTDWQGIALGNTITIDGTPDFKVAGVFNNPPKNSSLQFDFVLNYEELRKQNPPGYPWGSFDSRVLVSLNEGFDEKAVSKKIAGIVKENNEYVDEDILFLYPFESIYLRGKFENGVVVGGRIEYVQLFTLAALFLLLIACINFMNLATARASLRAKEVGVRKTIGAGRAALIKQFMVEAGVITFLSFVLAVLLGELFLPNFQEITGKQVSLNYSSTSFWALTGGLGLITAILAGSYPAFFLSSFKIINILKGSLTRNMGGNALRKSLVVFQFVLSVLLIVGATVVTSQVDFLKNKNLGLDKENVLFFRTPPGARKNLETFENELKKIPGIQKITKTGTNPLSVGSQTGDPKWEGMGPDEELIFNVITTDPNFLTAMNIPLVEGRDFSTELSTDTTNYILNETAVKAMNLKDPIGKGMEFWGVSGSIVGVVKDFHISSLHESIEPLIIANIPNFTSLTLLKIDPQQTESIIAGVGTTFKKFAEGKPYRYDFLDDRYWQMYQNEERTSALSKWFAIIALFISCLGLFGLSTFIAEQKTKEIGIRKVLGATVENVVFLLSRNFLKLIGISLAIAFPIAWYFSNQWLSDYAYQINLHWGFFVFAGILAIGIAFLTISFQSIKAALANPVESLRNE